MSLALGPTPVPSWPRRMSGVLYRHPRLRLSGLLAGPMLWLGLAYLGSLGILLLSAFWSTDPFTGSIVHQLTLDNVRQIASDSLYRDVALRSLAVAALVTTICIVVAFPMALYMSKVAGPRARRLLVVAVLTPLWASYLVKAYAWRSMFAGGGVLNWLLSPVGLRGPGFGLTATVVVLSYLWLPFMVLPIYTGLERLPDSLLDASGDLGASAGRTVRSVVLPLVVPAIAAGSIFTFSLSLGDYITVQIVGGKSQLIGNLIYTNVGSANNLPLAAALAMGTVLVMVTYLFAVRRSGAMDEL